MKKTITSPQTAKRTKSASSKGFALVATILVMSMLMLLSVSMLSMSSVSTRGAAVSDHQQIANANARMAAMIALNDLQELLGPDTRVTANVSVSDPDSPNPYWVSVYKTRPDENLNSGSLNSGKFVVDHHDDKLYLTDVRGDDKQPALAHLVSGQDVDPSLLLKEEDSVKLLNTGNEKTSVRAPLVKVKGSSMAYWVSDNSVKGLYNKKHIANKKGGSDAESSNEVYYSAAIAQDFNFEQFEVNGVTPLSDYGSKGQDELDKGLSLDASELIFSELSGEVLKESFHSITSDSAAVFSNPQVGGLKRDLTPFIERGDMKVAAGGDDQGLGLKPLLSSEPIIKGDHHNMTSPRMAILKDWADMRFRVTGTKANAAIETQTPDNSFVQSFSRSLPLKRRDLTNVDGNYIQPIVVEASLGWDFSPYRQGAQEKLRTHIFPRLILWNPYNVTLKKRRYVMLTNLPFYGTFIYRSTGKFAKGNFRYPDVLGMTKSALGNPGWAFPGFVTTEVSLAPGECKVFTPDMVNSKGTSLAGKARAFDQVNYANNVLTPDVVPGSNNFYHDSDKVLTVAESTANKNSPYGFSGDSNNFFGNYELCSDEYVVLQSNVASPSSITHKDMAKGDSQFEVISHTLAQNNSEGRYAKWYAAQNSHHAVNGTNYFVDITKWSADRLPPRLWRRGVRMQWYDETAEAGSTHMYKLQDRGRLTVPFVASSNLRGGVLNHPSPLSVRFQNYGSWEVPFLNGYLYFRQPTDPELFKSFYPPSPIGKPDDGYPERVVLFDIPHEDPGIFSMGQFQHAQFSYLAWHPTYALGSSYSTEQSDLDATALRGPTGTDGFSVKDKDRWSTSASFWGPGTFYADGVAQRAGSDNTAAKKHGDEVLIYDISYELNHSIWDRFMLSSVPYKGTQGNRTMDWDGKSVLPVSKYMVRPTAKHTVDELVENIKTHSSFLHYHAAEMFLNHGALNVNCDNKQVWKAFLLSLQEKSHPNLENQEIESGATGISRNVLATNAGATSITSSSEDSAWNGFRALSEDEIDMLAEKIVEQIRERGPSMSLSDFINRRLSKERTKASSGAMQAAIEASGINASLETDDGFKGDKTNESVSSLDSIANRVDFKSAGLPGYFSQNDLLTVLAPSLTARGDTFTIRSYGDSRDAAGTIKARAYCELVVQRQPEYIDSSDSAIEPVRIYKSSSNTWELNEKKAGEEGLSEINLRLGRRFKILKFKWLAPNEI